MLNYLELAEGFKSECDEHVHARKLTGPGFVKSHIARFCLETVRR